MDTLKVPKIFLSFWLKLDILTIHKSKRKLFEILICNTYLVNSDFLCLLGSITIHLKQFYCSKGKKYKTSILLMKRVTFWSSFKHAINNTYVIEVVWSLIWINPRDKTFCAKLNETKRHLSKIHKQSKSNSNFCQVQLRICCHQMNHENNWGL